MFVLPPGGASRHDNDDVNATAAEKFAARAETTPLGARITRFAFLQFAGCASDKQGSQRVNSFPMKDVHARNSMTHPDARRDAPVSRTELPPPHFSFSYSFLFLPFSLLTLFFCAKAPVAPFRLIKRMRSRGGGYYLRSRSFRRNGGNDDFTDEKLSS